MKIIGPPPRPAERTAEPPVPPPAPHPATGSRLWLARHARVALDYHDVAYGAADVPLSADGLAETRRLALAFREVPVQVVYSSDLERALVMGRAIAGACQARLVTTAELREVDRGEWQGLSKPEFHARWVAAAAEYWRDPWRWRVPGGDGDASLFERAWPAVERAVREAAGGTAVITAHANLIRVVIGRALGVSVEESYRYATDPAHASLLVDSAEGWRLVSWNVARPLAAEGAG